ncbi:MAG TPA: hypothetical protein VF593_14375 [Chthoniobacteraceae bacterium]|jgi:hypothetical protein
MKRHTPSLESVWAEWYRHQRIRKIRADRAARGIPEPRPTPPNSTPWLDRELQTLEDLRFVSNSVREHAEAWKSEFMKSSAR